MSTQKISSCKIKALLHELILFMKTEGPMTRPPRTKNWRKHMKKLLSLTLAALMAVSMLSGCSNGGNSSYHPLPVPAKSPPAPSP